MFGSAPTMSGDLVQAPFGTGRSGRPLRLSLRQQLSPWIVTTKAWCRTHEHGCGQHALAGEGMVPGAKVRLLANGHRSTLVELGTKLGRLADQEGDEA